MKRGKIYYSQIVEIWERFLEIMCPHFSESYINQRLMIFKILLYLPFLPIFDVFFPYRNFLGKIL